MVVAAPPFLEAIEDALAGASADRALVRWSTAPRAPWHAWLLVALARQIRAQRWALGVWRGALAGAPNTRRALPRVPGTVGYKYTIEGRRLTLIAADGGTVQVDDHGDDGLTLEASGFAYRMQCLPKPAFPERRLLALLPYNALVNENILLDAIEQLADVGLIRPGEAPGTFRLPPALEVAARALATADFSSRAARARWALHMGDNIYLDDEHCEQQRRAHLRYLTAGLYRMPRAFLSALEPLLPPADFVEACALVIDGEAGGQVPAGGRPSVGDAIERLEKHPDYPYCPAVARYARLVDPARDYAYAPYMAARYLLRRGRERDLAVRVAVTFAEAENHPFARQLALLLLEHAPGHALSALRRSLRLGDDDTQRTASAALAALDQPFYRRDPFRA